MISESIDSEDLHMKQFNIWELEHKCPTMFPTVASNVPDPGVVRYWVYLQERLATNEIAGLEICCGKGRNCIWLAENGAKMTGFDFSPTAIRDANRCQEALPSNQRVDFRIHDALENWPFESESFDFIVDSFGTADIESASGRDFVISEATRVLKKGGYYLLQIDSPKLGFFAERIKSHPGPEPNTLLFPNGKIESVLTESDIRCWDQNNPLKLKSVRNQVEHNVEICGKTIPYEFFWIVLQSP